MHRITMCLITIYLLDHFTVLNPSPDNCNTSGTNCKTVHKTILYKCPSRIKLHGMPFFSESAHKPAMLETYS